MRLKALILRNFRGYKGEVQIPIHSDMTAVIGKTTSVNLLSSTHSVSSLILPA